MNIDINTDPRLSPTERMVLQQVRDRLHQAPRRPTDRVIVEALTFLWSEFLDSARRPKRRRLGPG